MKRIISFSVFSLMMVFATMASAQVAAESAKPETVEIRTSAVCGMCKNTIETALFKVKGVKAANLNVDTKVVEVMYNPSKVSVAQIRTAISMAGYDADDVLANETAYSKLHACCKKDSHE